MQLQLVLQMVTVVPGFFGSLASCMHLARAVTVVRCEGTICLKSRNASIRGMSSRTGVAVTGLKEMMLVLRVLALRTFGVGGGLSLRGAFGVSGPLFCPTCFLQLSRPTLMLEVSRLAGCASDFSLPTLLANCLVLLELAKRVLVLLELATVLLVASFCLSHRAL